MHLSLCEEPQPLTVVSHRPFPNSSVSYIDHSLTVVSHRSFKMSIISVGMFELTAALAVMLLIICQTGLHQESMATLMYVVYDYKSHKPNLHDCNNCEMFYHNYNVYSMLLTTGVSGISIFHHMEHLFPVYGWSQLYLPMTSGLDI